MKLTSLVALSLVLPSVALAGEMSNALSFAGQWGASTVGYARTLFPALLLVAFIVEIVFRDPSTPPSFKHSLWRAAIVFALLTPPSTTSNRTLYGELCGVLAGVSDDMVLKLAPSDPWKEFANVAESWQRDLDEAKKGHQAEGLVAQIGGNIFTNILALALLLGQGAMWVMNTLASVLVILLYALGPLALVFWLPLKSDSLGRWLRTFLTVMTWPVLSAVILAIITKASLRGLNGSSPAFATISIALLLGVTALAVPVVSSSLVGGSMGAIGAGMSTLMQTAGLGAAMATGAAGGAATAAGAAKGLGSKVATPAAKGLANAMSADSPMSDGPPAKGGPVVPAREALLPNAIDAVPIHGAPAVEQDGLGLGAPPPPPADALSGRVAAPNAAPGRSPVAALEDAAAQGKLRPPAPPAEGGGGAGGGGGGGRGAGAGGAARAPKPPPPVPTAAIAAKPAVAPAPAARRAAAPPDAPTAPAKPRVASWGATLERLANEAVSLELNPDSNAKAQQLRAGEKQRELDRAVKAVAAGTSVEEWQQDEARLREAVGD